MVAEYTLIFSGVQDEEDLPEAGETGDLRGGGRGKGRRERKGTMHGT